MVSADPVQAHCPRQSSADKQIATARPESDCDAAVDVVAERAETGKAVAGRPDDTELSIVVFAAHWRNRIRISVDLESRAEMENQRWRNRVVEIPASHRAL